MRTKILILLIALLPVATFAGNGDKNKNKVQVNITVDKTGKAKIELPADMQQLQTDLNNALKDVTINITDGKERKEVNVNLQISTK